MMKYMFFFLLFWENKFVRFLFIWTFQNELCHKTFESLYLDLIFLSFNFFLENKSYQISIYFLFSLIVYFKNFELPPSVDYLLIFFSNPFLLSIWLNSDFMIFLRWNNSILFFSDLKISFFVINLEYEI